MPSDAFWRIVSSNRITPLTKSAAPVGGEQHLAVRAPAVLGRLAADRVEALLDRAAALVGGEDALARCNQRPRRLFSARSSRVPSCHASSHSPSRSRRRLLPLDRAGRLRRDVVGDPVHAGHLVDDPRRDALEHLVGQAGPVGGHRVVGRHGAQHDRVRVRAVVAHHADGLHRGQHREALPDLAVEPGAADLLDHDRVGLLQDLDALARDRADDAHREPGTGERLAPHDLLGQPELLADRAHLVLEQLAQRLDELEVHVVGQAADVVVALDVRVVAAARLDDVGIQRALHEEARRRRDPARLPRTRG